MDLLLMWPGRCGICGKPWLGRCYHESDEHAGFYRTERRQFLPSRTRMFWLGALCGVLWTVLAVVVLRVVF